MTEGVDPLNLIHDKHTGANMPWLEDERRKKTLEYLYELYDTINDEFDVENEFI